MFIWSFLAFVLLHLAIPAISIVFFGASSLWLFSGIAFAIATVKSIHTTDSAYVVAFLCLLSGLAFALALMLGTSYYMQGEGFNDAFFYHLSIDTLVIATRNYGDVLYPSLLGLLLAVLTPAIIYKRQSHNLWPVVPVSLLWVLALVGSYPLYSLTSYLAAPADESASSGLHGAMNLARDSKPVQPTLLKNSTQRKNIILIYAESLEELYFDKEIFGDLLPNIRALSANAQRFTNLVQVDGTGWTIAGIVASQCGFPMKVNNPLAINSTVASVEKPYPDRVCLADILSENGYQTIYLGGAPLWFAGKGNFLRTHGYKRVTGFEELRSLIFNKEYYSGWGIYDDSLFHLALSELRALENENQPYLLTLLTLDTHHPKGLPSKSCNELPNNRNPMSNAIYCSDQLIGDFIRKAMEIVDMSKTIIVLFSDHLSLRNTLWNELKDNQQDRRLMFMILNDAPAMVSGIQATHFDVAPTVLEAAGFTDQLSIGAGVSLFSLSSDQQSTVLASPQGVDAPSLLKSGISARKNGVTISRKNLSLSIGDLTLRAHKNGEKFVSGIFLVALDENDNVVDTAYSETFGKLARNLDGSYVVGLAVMSKPPYTAKYFYGKITQDFKGMTQGLLKNDVHLGDTDLWPSKN